MPRRLPSTRHKEHARVKPRLSIRRLGADRAPQRWRSSGFRPPGIGSVGPCSPAMGVYWDILGPFVKIPHFGRLALTFQTFIDFHRVSSVNHKKAERVGSARKKTPSNIREFIIDTKRNAPDLSYRVIAQKVEAQFGYSLDKGTVGNIIRRNRARVVGSEAELEATEAHVANRVESFIHVQATTGSEGMDVLPHISASLTSPIHLYWEVQNRADRTVRYMQLNVWLPRGMFWDPQTPNQALWEEQGGDQLTGSLKVFHEINDFRIGTLFNRWLIRLPPENGFVLIPSEHSYALPPMVVMQRPWVGVRAVPWKVEVPGMKPEAGALLLWCERRREDAAYLKSDLIGIDFDRKAVAAEERRIIASD